MRQKDQIYYQPFRPPFCVVLNAFNIIFGQSKLYPTVGLQTPGEVVDANFGQEPFKFEIEDMVEELRSITQTSIYNNPLPDGFGDWSATMHKYNTMFVRVFRVLDC